jgi:hypothetical protein
MFVVNVSMREGFDDARQCDETMEFRQEFKALRFWEIASRRPPYWCIRLRVRSQRIGVSATSGAYRRKYRTHECNSYVDSRRHDP